MGTFPKGGGDGGPAGMWGFGGAGVGTGGAPQGVGEGMSNVECQRGSGKPQQGGNTKGDEDAMGNLGMLRGVGYVTTRWEVGDARKSPGRGNSGRHNKFGTRETCGHTMKGKGGPQAVAAAMRNEGRYRKGHHRRARTPHEVGSAVGSQGCKETKKAT